MKKHIITTLMIALVPFLSQAQGLDGTSAESLVKSIAKFFNGRVIPLLLGLALVYLIWSIVQYIGANDDSAHKSEKKQQIFWGFIGLFVIVSVWSLVAVVANSFGIFAGGSLKIK